MKSNDSNGFSQKSLIISQLHRAVLSAWNTVRPVEQGETECNRVHVWNREQCVPCPEHMLKTVKKCLG